MEKKTRVKLLSMADLVVFYVPCYLKQDRKEKQRFCQRQKVYIIMASYEKKRLDLFENGIMEWLNYFADFIQLSVKHTGSCKFVLFCVEA